jgi:Family of unknown function (DUF6364)
MDTKLTLKLEQSVIEKAKLYAKSNKISLSDLFENYLNNILSNANEQDNITPLVKSLSGIVKMENIENDKSGYADYLIKKYT